MVLASQINPGMILDLDEKVYRVESSVKVTVTNGTPFIKTKLRDLLSDKMVEKNFKTNQQVQEVKPLEQTLEFLYDEGKNYVFLNADTLELSVVNPEILGDKINYLKEGIPVKAKIYGKAIYSIELLEFLELMVVKVEDQEESIGANAMRIATIETGAKIEVPLFIEPGDVIKVNTHNNEYIQRV